MRAATEEHCAATTRAHPERHTHRPHPATTLRANGGRAPAEPIEDPAGISTRNPFIAAQLPAEVHCQLSRFELAGAKVWPRRDVMPCAVSEGPAQHRRAGVSVSQAKRGPPWASRMHRGRPDSAAESWNRRLRGLRGRFAGDAALPHGAGRGCDQHCGVPGRERGSVRRCCAPPSSPE